METPTDSALMDLIRQGDTAQLALLFERHHLGLFRYLVAMTRDRALSEDLVQEVFFRVLKYARTYDVAQPFSAWLLGMARNAYFDSRHKRRGELSAMDLAEMRSSEPMAEEMFSKKQDVLFLRKALDNLPEEKRELLVLSRFQNLRYEEIARILGCEIGTVKVRVYRALRELREKFCDLRGEKVV